MKNRWVVVIVAAIAVFGIYAVSTIDHRGDEDQIKSMVSQATMAMNNRSFGGVAACISKDYKDQYGLNCDRLQMLIAQALRDERGFHVQSKITRLEVDAENAKLNVDVSISSKNGGGISYNRNLYFILKKENDKHLLVIPTKKWRVIRADNLGLDLDQDF